MEYTLKAFFKLAFLLIYICFCIYLFLLITFYDPAKNYLLKIIDFFTNLGILGYFLIATFGVIWFILCCPASIFE